VPPPYPSQASDPSAVYAHPSTAHPPGADHPPQRPGVIAMAATMAVTASLQWICALSFAWLVARAGVGGLDTSGVDGGIYHILNRFNDRLLDGLAWPLYLFPAVSFVLGFVLLARRQWARWAFTLCGALALGWSAWWLRSNLVWWLAPAVYIAVSVLIVWTAAANRWYGWRPVRVGLGPLAGPTG
jgi:hypothetical protein